MHSVSFNPADVTEVGNTGNRATWFVRSTDHPTCDDLKKSLLIGPCGYRGVVFAVSDIAGVDGDEEISSPAALLPT